MCSWFGGPWFGGGFGGMFMMLPMLIFWGLIIWGAVTLVRKLGATQFRGPMQSTPVALEILKERYAKGEINRDEFERMKKEIE